MPEPFGTAGSGCASCPYSRQGRPSQFLLPVGPKRAPQGLLVLGSGPTKDEVKAGEQLSGLMGREVAEVFAEAGIDKDKILVANAYACVPIEPRRDTEERAAVKCCRPLLRYYVDQLPPETPTLLAGKWAMLAMTGKEKGLFATRGFVDMEYTLDELYEVEEGEDDA